MNGSSGSYRQLKDLKERRRNEDQPNFNYQGPESDVMGNTGEVGTNGGIEMDTRNPFTMPSDEEVFRLRDEERKRRAVERERQKNLKAWQKGTSATGPRGGKLRELMTMSAPDPSSGDGSVRDGKLSRRARNTRGVMQAATRAIANDRRQEKESMAEFIAKKREMFLVQMSLDTKREEIRKLEEKAQMKEEALKKSEQMLEEDAIRFDTFLKENDKKAHEAIKKAETESQLKNQKMAEIKKKNQEIAMVISEMSKHQEALDDCKKYKKFLDDLTPQEWFDTQAYRKKERQERRRRDRINARLKRWEEKKQQIIREAERQEAAEAEALAKAGKVRRKGEKKQRILEFPPRPHSDEEELTSSDEDCPMYFREPSQLLEIFQGLEEQNLFLIQNSQETEHALEELNKTFRQTKEKMDEKTAALKKNIQELENQIDAEQKKSNTLDHKLKSSHGNLQGQQEKLLNQLNLKVKEVYSECDFDTTSNPRTLTMLSDLESRLEDLLKSVALMPVDYVRKAEKDKDKKRREKKRQEQQILAEKLQEERNKKSIERSLQAPKKRTGRQVMFRSQPVRRTIREDKKEDNEEDLDEKKFFT